MLPQPENTPLCRDVAVIALERHAPPEGGDGNLYTLRLQAPGWNGWKPGQFVMIRPRRAGTDVTWGRPFSISRADDKELIIVFQVVGRGTEAILDLSPGELVTVWGPLGNGFDVLPAGPTLLLAGGIGIAPFVGYIKNHPRPETLRMDFGHRLPLECYPFEACGCSGATVRNHHEQCRDDLDAFLATLESGIKEIAAQGGLVLACGPMPFLKSIQKFALRHGARAQLSLETRMACGVGACLGCVVKSSAHGGEHQNAPETPTAFRYVQTCTCGPVFWADQLNLDEA